MWKLKPPRPKEFYRVEMNGKYFERAEPFSVYEGLELLRREGKPIAK